MLTQDYNICTLLYSPESITPGRFPVFPVAGEVANLLRTCYGFAAGKLQTGVTDFCLITADIVVGYR